MIRALHRLFDNNTKKGTYHDTRKLLIRIANNTRNNIELKQLNRACK